MLSILLVGNGGNSGPAYEYLLVHWIYRAVTEKFIVRIAASAMMISNQKPSKPMLIAETVLQGIGLSPLLFEVSLVLLRRYVIVYYETYIE